MQDIHLAGRPVVGTLVLDGRRNRVGRVMGNVGPHVQLRPPAGGREWDCAPGDVKPIGPR